MSSCKLVSATVSSPVGNWDFEVCSAGLHWLKLAKEVDNNNFMQLGKEKVALTKESDDKQVVSCANWLQDFFSDGSKENKDGRLPAICPLIFGNQNPTFRQKVQKVLYEKVGYGQTVSYGELASLAGSPGASRAVGSAMANNPVSLVIPCHRVVKADGSPGNYSGATKNDVKVWLLEHEKNN